MAGPGPGPGGTRGTPETPVQVSVIVPVHNSECWLDECLKSVWEQDFEGAMELSIFNDASKDGSAEIIKKWKIRLEEVGIPVIIGSNDSSEPRGVGFAKNQAVIQSSGTYLCFLDSNFIISQVLVSVLMIYDIFLDLDTEGFSLSMKQELWFKDLKEKGKHIQLFLTLRKVDLLVTNLLTNVRVDCCS
ncbi:hypothetical protein BTVI_138486 [Pitangus sulphuratus]|nr:hypothetical protein BTVI_138486 [Pitangus sulphuratus]